MTSFLLYPGAPYRLDFTVWALRRRDRNATDRWDGSYHRALTVGDRVVPVRVAQVEEPRNDPRGQGHRQNRPGHSNGQQASGPVLRVSLPEDSAYSRHDVSEIWDQLTTLLGVAVDMADFYRVVAADPRTQRLADRFRGVRPPRFPSLFETAANAIANQQVSLESGLTMLNRLVAALGVSASDPEGGVAFPTPASVLAADPGSLRSLGFSNRKVAYLRNVADAALGGILVADELSGLGREAATRRLMEIPGIGRWSAEYILLRGLGRIDIFPGDDVGARNKLRAFLGLDHDPDYVEIAERLQPWQPYAGLLYFHLLLDGLAERGVIAGVGETPAG